MQQMLSAAINLFHMMKSFVHITKTIAKQARNRRRTDNFLYKLSRRHNARRNAPADWLASRRVLRASIRHLLQRTGEQLAGRHAL